MKDTLKEKCLLSITTAGPRKMACKLGLSTFFIPPMATHSISNIIGRLAMEQGQVAGLIINMDQGVYHTGQVRQITEA